MNNQKNIVFCIVAAAFIGASVYTMLTCESCPPFNQYKSSLSPELKQLHDKVAEERRNLYLMGLIIGTVLAFGYLWMNNLSLNPLKHSCTFVAIALVTQYMVYTLTPKKYHMLPNLKSSDQIQGWYNVYHHMKGRYHMGMILGVVGYFLLAWSISTYNQYY